jgi:hypothetical protein
VVIYIGARGQRRQNDVQELPDAWKVEVKIEQFI